tara:strand:- start:1731 stop:2354 length:624 start_codon:yes stop_codon:yes gene_type:complete
MPINRFDQKQVAFVGYVISTMLIMFVPSLTLTTRVREADADASVVTKLSPLTRTTVTKILTEPDRDDDGELVENAAEKEHKFEKKYAIMLPLLELATKTESEADKWTVATTWMGVLSLVSFCAIYWSTMTKSGVVDPIMFNVSLVSSILSLALLVYSSSTYKAYLEEQSYDSATETTVWQEFGADWGIVFVATYFMSLYKMWSLKMA